jgi:hypothetical protein
MKTAIFVCLTALSLLACSGPKPNPSMLADRDPIAIGVIEMEFEKFLSSSLEKKEVQVFFAPRSDSVYLQFKYQTITYLQYWNRQNRAAFIAALAAYRRDYDERNLVLGPSKASRAYGTFKGYIEWGQFNIGLLMSAKAEPRMEFGYRFNGESPYFTVLQRSSPDISGSGSDSRESLNIRTYYTRAQAGELAEHFDQDFLLSLLGGHVDPPGSPPPQDSYNEAE